MATLKEKPDVIIVSEVLEHLADKDFDKVMKMIRTQLAPDGILLVTVPNGYGWFEFENLLWNQLGLGWLLQKLKIISLIERIKFFLFGNAIIHPPHPSSISNSPHIQRFTLAKIKARLKDHEFEHIQSEGSTLFSGPFSNLMFHGIKLFLKINNRLGSWFPHIASGFFISCKIAKNHRS